MWSLEKILLACSGDCDEIDPGRTDQGLQVRDQPMAVGNRCRFYPSCSAYAVEALQKHGALKGVRLAGWRLLRCHPWCDGGHDPVP